MEASTSHPYCEARKSQDVESKEIAKLFIIRRNSDHLPILILRLCRINWMPFFDNSATVRLFTVASCFPRPRIEFEAIVLKAFLCAGWNVNGTTVRAKSIVVKFPIAAREREQTTPPCYDPAWGIPLTR
eukprot:scaffold4073_cov68-Cylindrotheca_fusiformis.AAC.2